MGINAAYSYFQSGCALLPIFSFYLSQSCKSFRRHQIRVHRILTHHSNTTFHNNRATNDASMKNNNTDYYSTPVSIPAPDMRRNARSQIAREPACHDRRDLRLGVLYFKQWYDGEHEQDIVLFPMFNIGVSCAQSGWRQSPSLTSTLESVA